ncbi:hypothetical protein Patl1_09625 [Pistacia atlantica]|uniref:Uncharacterized protein n=1 Tax=Pistacia atlantica TaxID=434234 RepID=A0ACC1A868_9ROSI|nr:hypothetical protein Patl1_09625 [Pistacia atlantica]
MIDQFINFVIRPPSSAMLSRQIITQISIYGKEISLLQADRTKDRTWRQLRNVRGHALQCSHYMPSVFPGRYSFALCHILPWKQLLYLLKELQLVDKKRVETYSIFCEKLYSGCRADANEAAVILLPSNITVFTLDFSGSGLSDGDYVSLGWHEKDDLKVVVSYLRSNKQISRVGLWGRSMGAVTSLLYGAEDPSIAGMVLDSAFSDLFNLMMELVDVYKIRLPKFTVRISFTFFSCAISFLMLVTVKMAVQYMRRVIQKKAKFDIMNLNCLKVAPKTFIPALFGHANEDKFIQPHHSDDIFNSYVGDKNIIKFDGDHNSSRPQFYYDSVSIFFFNVLHPPQISSACPSKVEKYYDLGDLKVGAGMDESLLYEIITGLRSASTDAASSSTHPIILATKPVNELLSGVGPVTSIDSLVTDDNGLGDESSNLQDKLNGQNDECCSYTSSNRESWGRCSSLGGSDEESSADCAAADRRHQTTLEALATPVRSKQKKSSDSSKEEKKKKKAVDGKKPKREKFEKLEALSKRLRLCLLRRVKHQRHLSS